jgi:hypothetical protein
MNLKEDHRSVEACSNYSGIMQRDYPILLIESKTDNPRERVSDSLRNLAKALEQSLVQTLSDPIRQRNGFGVAKYLNGLVSGIDD